jgi:hypothetical protein
LFGRWCGGGGGGGGAPGTEGVTETTNTGRTRFEDWKDCALMTWVTCEDRIKKTLRK